MLKFKVGDRVKGIAPRTAFHDKIGRVIKIGDPIDYPYCVKFALTSSYVVMYCREDELVATHRVIQEWDHEVI